MSYDVFICHASEDKESFVAPLAQSLMNKGLRVWYDVGELTIGDSLRRKIDYGLSNSKYGIVVLSNNFFQKAWPQYELDGLTQLEMTGRKAILPIWHGVTRADVMNYSPTLSDRLAISSAEDLEVITNSIMQVVAPNLMNNASSGEAEAISNPFPINSVKPSIFPKMTELLLPEIRDCINIDSGSVIFSPNNRNCTYMAGRGNKVVPVINGKYAKTGFDRFSDHTLTYSPDSKRVAYGVGERMEFQVYINEEPLGEVCDGIANNGIHFSPDSRRIAYQCMINNKWFVSVDGRMGRPYEGTGNTFFSADSKNVAYVGFRDGKAYLVINHREDREVNPDREGYFEFAADGNKVHFIEDSKSLSKGIYIENRSAKEVAEIARIAGVPVGTGDGSDLYQILAGTTVESPNGLRTACVVAIGYELGVVVDGRREVLHDAIHQDLPKFSEDSKHVAYVAEDYNMWRLVVDGVASDSAYSAFVGGNVPYFLESNILNAVAFRNNRMYYIETHLK